MLLHIQDHQEDHLITYRLRDVPHGSSFGSTVTIGDYTHEPAFFIRDHVNRWLAADPSLPRVVCVTGLSDEPLECDVEELPSYAYLFPKSK